MPAVLEDTLFGVALRRSQNEASPIFEGSQKAYSLILPVLFVWCILSRDVRTLTFCQPVGFPY